MAEYMNFTLAPAQKKIQRRLRRCAGYLQDPCAYFGGGRFNGLPFVQWLTNNNVNNNNNNNNNIHCKRKYNSNDNNNS